MLASNTTGSKATVQQLLQQMPGWKDITSPGSHKVLSLIERCRTAGLGYHAYRCKDSDCGAMQYVYHSCRNRHCPQWGHSKKEEWIEARMKELLPVKYYHAVFTMPHQLNSLVMGNRKAMFDLLFDAASYTLLKFAADEKYLAAQPGIIMVLHTWGQQLNFHPHVHCIVSGGGITSPPAPLQADGFAGRRIFKKVRTAHTAATLLQNQALWLPGQLQTKAKSERDIAADGQTPACTAGTSKHGYKNDRKVWY